MNNNGGIFMNTGFEVKTGYYSTVGIEDTTLFNFNIGMSLADQAALINTVSNLLIEEDTKTYNSILKDYFFMFFVIVEMTDVDLRYVFDKDQADKNYFVNQVEKVVSTTNIFQIVSVNNKELIEQMYKALNDNLSYKTGVREDLNNVVTSLQRLVDTVFEKIKELDIDVVNNAAENLANITGDVTADKIVGAFQESADYKGSEEVIESKNAEIRELKAKVNETADKTEVTEDTATEGDE